MKRLTSSLLCLLVTGCAVQPYRPKPINPTSLFKQIEVRRLDSFELHGFLMKQFPAFLGRWPPKGWDFEALTLAALYFSPELDLARRQWASADAAIATASQRPNPALVLPLEYGTDISKEEKPWTIGIGINIPFETAGKRGYRLARAAHLSQSARYRIGSAVWKTRNKLRAALLELHLAQRRSDLLHKRAESFEKIVGLLDNRQRQGATSVSEVAEQRNLLAARVAEQNAAYHDQAVARANVAAAIGVPILEIERIVLDLKSFDRIRADIPDQETRRSALLNRPELRVALAEYEASQAALQLQVARQYPDLALGPGYTWDAGTNRFAFGTAGIELPIFHRNEGPIAEAEAARSVAGSAVKQVQLHILHEIERAVSAYQSAQSRLDEAERSLIKERERLARVRRAFDAGQADRLDLVMAEQTLHTYTLAHEELIALVKRAIASLDSAVPSLLSTRLASVWIELKEMNEHNEGQ